MEALKSADRMDLVGFDKKCLIRPRQDKNSVYGKTSHGSGGKSQNRGGAGQNRQGKGTPKKKKAIRNVHKKKAK